MGGSSWASSCPHWLGFWRVHMFLPSLLVVAILFGRLSQSLVHLLGQNMLKSHTRLVRIVSNCCRVVQNQGIQQMGFFWFCLLFLASLAVLWVSRCRLEVSLGQHNAPQATNRGNGMANWLAQGVQNVTNRPRNPPQSNLKRQGLLSQRHHCSSTVKNGHFRRGGTTMYPRCSSLCCKCHSGF